MNNIFKKGLKLIYTKLQKYFKEDQNLKNKNLINRSLSKNKQNKTNNNNNNNDKILKNNNKYYNTINLNNHDNDDNDNNDNNDNNYLKIKTNESKLENTFIKEKQKEPEIYTVAEIKNKLNTIWDILKINENTQAEHLIKSIPSDQWVNMEEIKKRINLEFGIEYKNEKSLYPYLKTLVDINLIKVNNTSKKRSWKKNIIILE